MDFRNSLRWKEGMIGKEKKRFQIETETAWHSLMLFIVSSQFVRCHWTFVRVSSQFLILSDTVVPVFRDCFRVYFNLTGTSSCRINTLIIGWLIDLLMTKEGESYACIFLIPIAFNTCITFHSCTFHSCTFHSCTFHSCTLQSCILHSLTFISQSSETPVPQSITE